MPSSIDKLQKFLKLEVDRSYDNRAIVGGLDKILPWWVKEASAEGLNEAVIQGAVSMIQSYAAQDVQDRAECVTKLLKVLDLPQPARSMATPPQETTTQKSPIVQIPVKPAAPVGPNPTQTSTTSTIRPSTPRPATTPIGLNAPLTVLPGIGPRNSQLLQSLGLNTLEDLLYYFPRRYDDYSKLKPIDQLKAGDELTILGTIQSIFSRDIRGGSSKMTEAVLTDGTSFIRLTWFGSAWLITEYHPGDQVAVSGKVDLYLGRLVMNHPEIEHLEREQLHTNRIVPVYSLTSGISQKTLRRTMFQTIPFWSERVTDFLPLTIQNNTNLINLQTALQQIHFPENQEMLAAARSRLAFDEIFLLQIGVLAQKRNWQAGAAEIFTTSADWLDAQFARLPYQLTHAQLRSLEEIRLDLASGKPMNRLLQGDVGSGKTVVAALSIAMLTQTGAQAALMAPTSILADQHYRTLLRMLTEDQPGRPTPLKPAQIRLLIGDTAESEKKEIVSGLEDGSILLIIGTHALIESPVIFKHLQLVIVDEQHRFGVAQRSALRSKGDNPHLLVMTATPIPRSLALTIYGDLDLSVMDEMPAGRLPIETHILSPLERERAYALISSQVEKGFQAFIIYPLVELGDKDEGQAAVEGRDQLQKDIFPHLKLGLLHGRMKPEEKDKVMERFRNNEFQILVSTSVVEVGVDISNATVMLVEGANRFGLAQLHQFRGRVGRGAAQSFCLLIPETEDAVENQRLAAMAETNDGFVLAEKDLQQRGPGDFLGTRQAGFAELRLASLMDIRLIEKARQQAQIIFAMDPELNLPEHSLLRDTYLRFWGAGKGESS